MYILNRIVIFTLTRFCIHQYQLEVAEWDLMWYIRHSHDVITIQFADFTQLKNAHCLKKCLQMCLIIITACVIE